MGRITETIRCMVRLTDSAILEVAIRWSSAFSRLTDALKAKIKRQTIEQPKRASGRSFASVVTRKRPSLNRAQNEPNFRLQLETRESLTSDGFVSPPAIEPNHDVWHAGGVTNRYAAVRAASVALPFAGTGLDDPSENETALSRSARTLYRDRLTF